MVGKNGAGGTSGKLHNFWVRPSLPTYAVVREEGYEVPGKDMKCDMHSISFSINRAQIKIYQGGQKIFDLSIKRIFHNKIVSHMSPM